MLHLYDTETHTVSYTLIYFALFKVIMLDNSLKKVRNKKNVIV